jgi:hypothetical protein
MKKDFRSCMEAALSNHYRLLYSLIFIHDFCLYRYELCALSLSYVGTPEERKGIITCKKSYELLTFCHCDQQLYLPVLLFYYWTIRFYYVNRRWTFACTYELCTLLWDFCLCRYKLCALSAYVGTPSDMGKKRPNYL